MAGNDTSELDKNGLGIPLKDLSRSTSSSSITPRLAKLDNELVDDGLPIHRVNIRHTRPSNDPSIPQIPLSPSSPRAFQRRFQGAARSTARIAALQERWGAIAGILPPQINLSVISIGGVIGTGLYIGTATALRHAGPGGTLLGYAITGTVVWAVVISIGEMVAFLPNVGGPVGLADVYVDPALGFALGWNAWYNWTIILPTELSAAAILFGGFFPNATLSRIKEYDLAAISVLLVLAIGINCFGSKVYGEAEFIFSCIKIITIIGLIISGIVLDITGPRGEGPIGFKNFTHPAAFLPYRGSGAFARFLGVWSSMNQAVFAFFGTEVPGIASGEVQNPTKNIPRAVNRVWIRITLFYLGAVFVAGLLVPSDSKQLIMGMSTRTSNPGSQMVMTSPFVIALQQSAVPHLDKVATGAFVLSAFSAATSDVYISSRFLFFLARRQHAPRFCGQLYSNSGKTTVVPWVGVFVAACFALLAFMAASDAEEAFHWLSSMNSTAALLAWIGMLYTYLRWYQGTKYAERQNPNFKKENQQHLYNNRNWTQPYAAIYAFIMCVLVVLFNGWFVFTRPGPWRMAAEPGDLPVTPDKDIGDWVPLFVSSYLAIPLFILLLLGYKLIYRTRMVRLHEMAFTRGNIEAIPEFVPTTWYGKVLAVLF